MPERSVRENPGNGLFLSDLIELAAKNGVAPADLYLTLCIPEVETHVSRIATALVDAEQQPDLNRKMGVLWLMLDPPAAVVVTDAFKKTNLS